MWIGYPVSLLSQNMWSPKVYFATIICLNQGLTYLFFVTDNSKAMNTWNISETKEEIGELLDNSIIQQCSTTEHDGNTLFQSKNVTSFICLVYTQ